MSENNIKISKFNIEYPDGNTETADIQIPMSAVEGLSDAFEEKLDKATADNLYIPKITSDVNNYRVIVQKTSGEYDGLLLATNSQRAHQGSIAQYLVDGNITTEPGGSLSTKTPTVDYAAANKKYVDNITNKLKEDIEIIEHIILPQTGVLVSDNIEDTYETRITAQGREIIDGSKAVLKKVIGNTVSCNNLFDISLVEPYPETGWTDTASYITEVSQNSITIVSGENYGSSSAVNGYTNTRKTLGALCPTLKIGDIVYLQFNTSATEGSQIYNAYVDGLGTWASGTSKTITQDSLSKELILYGSTIPSTTTIITNLQISKTLSTEYEPYFTGLKSASFGGIESGGKNLWNGTWEIGALKGADGTEVVSATSIRTSYIELTIGDYITSINGVETAIAVFIYTAEKTLSRFLGAVTSKFAIQDGEKYMRLVITNTTVFPEKFQIEAGTTATEYTPYIKPNVLSFPVTQMPLGRTIDFEAQKVTDYGVELVLNGTEDFVLNAQANTSGWGNVYQLGLGGKNADINILPISDSFEPSRWGSYFVDKTNVVAVSTAVLLIKTDGVQTLDDFKAYLAQRYADGNPVTIRYVSATLQSETDITADNEYTAYKGGTEKVLDNDGAEYGAENTLTQNYLFKIGGVE